MRKSTGRLPRVYLLARSSLNSKGIRQFLLDEQIKWKRTKDATPLEEIVEFGGRICYMSFGKAQSPKTTSAYIQNLINLGHESVLEHATWSFLVTGVSRAFSHQLVRHRIGFSFSQLSQQYHDERKATFVLPEVIKQNERAVEIWSTALALSRKAYNDILSELESHPPNVPVVKELKRALRSAARSVLPNATETKIFVTANARAIRHFLRVRGAIVGDAEMRRVSALILKAVKADAPAIFADFNIEFLPDGSPLVIIKSMK